MFGNDTEYRHKKRLKFLTKTRRRPTNPLLLTLLYRLRYGTRLLAIVAAGINNVVSVDYFYRPPCGRVEELAGCVFGRVFGRQSFSKRTFDRHIWRGSSSRPYLDQVHGRRSKFKVT